MDFASANKTGNVFFEHRTHVPRFFSKKFKKRSSEGNGANGEFLLGRGYDLSAPVPPTIPPPNHHEAAEKRRVCAFPRRFRRLYTHSLSLSLSYRAARYRDVSAAGAFAFRPSDTRARRRPRTRRRRRLAAPPICCCARSDIVTIFLNPRSRPLNTAAATLRGRTVVFRVCGASHGGRELQRATATDAEESDFRRCFPSDDNNARHRARPRDVLPADDTMPVSIQYRIIIIRYCCRCLQ